MLILLLVVAGLLLLPSVQTYLASKATDWLYTTYNVKASIAKVAITFPNKVELKDVFVEDDHNDTLIYAQKLKIAINGFDGEKNLAKINSVSLNNGRLYMRKYPQDSLFNFAYFLQKFAPETPDPNAPAFYLKIGKIDISQFSYTKHRLGCTDTCTNIFITDANIKMDKFFLDGDYVSGDIKHMSFKDADRFTLYEFRAKAAYQEKYMSLKDLYFKTDGSEVDGFAVLEYNKGNDFNDFLNLVNIRGEFKQSTFSSDEFISYIPQFPKFDVFKISAEFNGYVNHFDVTNCIIDLGNSTRFFGDLHIDEPTEANFLQIKARIGELKTAPIEFRKYIGPYIGEMEWMEMFDKFKTVEYAGDYEGTVKDFNIDGVIKLDHNVLDVNAKMNGFDVIETAIYKGDIATNTIHVEDFIADLPIKRIKFSASVDGKGFTVKDVAANVNGKVDFFDLNGYQFKNLLLQGHMSKGKFDGLAKLNDPNAKLDFTGKIDLSGDTIQSDFKADFKNINTYALGLTNEKISILNFKSDIDYKIVDKNWLDGTIDLYDLTYENENKFYFFDSINLKSSTVNNVHEDVLKSKMINASLNGDYDIFKVYKAFYSEYLHFNKILAHTEPSPNISFTYNVEFLNTELLEDVFVQELKIEHGAVVKGKYVGNEHFFNLDVDADAVQWKNITIDEIDLSLDHDGEWQNIDGKIGSIHIKNQIIDSISIKGAIIKDSILFGLRGVYRDSIDSYFRFRGFALDRFDKETEAFKLALTEGRFNIGNNQFELMPDNSINFKDGEIEFQNVGFFDENSSILIQGYKSKEPSKVLRITAANLNADLLNYALRYKELDFKGRMSGEAFMSYDRDLPRLTSSLLVDSLWINNDYLGKLNLESEWKIDSGKVALNANIFRKNLNMLTAKGNYVPDSTGYLDFNLNFNRFRLMWLDPFLEGILNNIKGTVTGNVKLSGSFKELITKGQLTLQKGALGVPYFNTHYNFDGDVLIDIEQNKISLPLSQIIDTKEATTGKIRAEATHKSFKDWAFNIYAETNNLLVLDTKNSDDASFYGKGYIAGNFSLTGPIDDLDINIKLKTNKGTDFKIPFSNPVSVGAQSFITYYGTGGNQNYFIDASELDKPKEIKLGGLDVFIDADITPDAKIELVMDETVGDIIKGRGTGNLRIDIPHDADMQIFGNVTLSSGDYLFTMGNIINKKFIITPESKITWQGDAYRPIVDMQAKYTTRTTLTGIVQNNYDGQRVQVDLLMNLDGVVLNPNIEFEILLPSSNASYQDELNNRLSDPDKLNTQAFSLLIINSFWPESDGTEGTENNLLGQSASSNTMQMASAQLSNWLAQGVGDYVDINVGYNTSTSNQLSDEIELDISKNFFNDRVTVNSKIDVPVGSSATSSSSAQNLTGDVEVVYKVTRDGRIRAKVFNRNNQDDPSLDKLAPYTYGVGIFYQTSFNTAREFIMRVFSLKPKDEELLNPDQNNP